MKEKLSVLRALAAALNDASITWAVGASVLLYCKGIVEQFNDIDILVMEDDVERVRELLLSVGTPAPPNPSEKYATKHFLEFSVDGVDVDVMAGFAIICDGVTHDCALRREQIVEWTTLDGVAIPLQSVELWRGYYQLMGREGKVELIDRVCVRGDRL